MIVLVTFVTFAFLILLFISYVSFQKHRSPIFDGFKTAKNISFLKPRGLSFLCNCGSLFCFATLVIEQDRLIIYARRPKVGYYYHVFQKDKISYVKIQKGTLHIRSFTPDTTALILHIHHYYPNIESPYRKLDVFASHKTISYALKKSGIYFSEFSY